jgi:hypothetical protein
MSSELKFKDSQVRKLSPTSALIVARVRIEAAAGGHDLSTETLTSTVWVKKMTDGWLNCIPQSRQLKAKSMSERC